MAALSSTSTRSHGSHRSHRSHRSRHMILQPDDISYHQNNDFEEDDAWIDDAPVFDHTIDLTPPESPVPSCAASTHSLSVDPEEDARGAPEPQPRVLPDYFQFPHSLRAKIGPTLLQPATPPPRIRTHSGLSHLSTPASSSRPHTPRRDSIFRHSSFKSSTASASNSGSPVIRLKSLSCSRRPSFLTSSFPFPLSSPRPATVTDVDVDVDVQVDVGVGVPPPPPPVPPAPPSQLFSASSSSSSPRSTPLHPASKTPVPAPVPVPAALPAPVPSIRGRSHRQPWLTASPLIISLIHECAASSPSGGGIFADGVRVRRPDSQVSKKQFTPLEKMEKIRQAQSRWVSNGLSFKLLARSALKSFLSFSVST
ncbi:hypothetical protein BOTBODRAFT_608892 [Botryobasidium botryosum FD-172 SS1]|uniref:Uncharacterized protein n=1 Tax=Botryobasidium botryosum (strain FD-172 SS1) TaxID=930990 RepID=A0A067LVU6_BOTB1|nr:hypothetical protein BOTBODRAFT_608892 [Botryobasidium botryosum FD-172 SS1]